MKQNPILAGTGHRPDKIAYQEPQIRIEIRAILDFYKPVHVISGMALGFDTWLADEAINMKIPLWAAVPFPLQDSRWLHHDRQIYRRLLAQATNVYIVHNARPVDGKQAAAWMHDRNAYMVDACDGLIACYNGDASGGTAHCYRYAKIRHKPIDEFNPYDLPRVLS